MKMKEGLVNNSVFMASLVMKFKRHEYSDKVVLCNYDTARSYFIECDMIYQYDHNACVLFFTRPCRQNMQVGQLGKDTIPEIEIP